MRFRIERSRQSPATPANPGEPGEATSPATPPSAPTPAPPSLPPDPAAARTLSRPPRPREGLNLWLCLLGCLLAAALVLFINLDHPEVVDHEEAMTLATSVQTHLRFNLPAPGPIFTTESLTPFLGDVAQWRMPPATVWIQTLSFRLLDPAETPMASYVAVARLGSGTMGLLTVAAVFWIGLSLGGLRAASFAALTLITCPAFVIQARLASPPAYYAAWHMLSLAAGLWALRPLRTRPSIARQAIGWSVCGLCMGVAILTAGPGALPSIGLPIVLFVCLCPNRVSHLLGLLAAVLFAGLTVLPWATYAHLQDPQAWPVDWRLWFPSEWLDLKPFMTCVYHRALMLLLGLAPWTLWLVGALAQPFSTSSAGGRLRLFLAWGWFLLATAILLGSASQGWHACLAVAIAVGAVFIGQVFDQYADLAGQGRFARLWRYLRWPQIFLCLVATVVAGLLLVAQPMLIEQGFLAAPVVSPAGWLLAAIGGVVLLGLLVMSAKWSWQEFPAKAMFAWAGWSFALLLLMLAPLARGPLARSSAKQDAAALATIVRDKPVFWLAIQPQQPSRERLSYDKLDPAILFYLGRPLIPLEPAALRQAGDERADFYLLAHAGFIPKPDRMTRVPGFQHEDLALWHFAGGEP
ncbi:MAG: hypothetical protein NTW19_19350 [Planctomycetota bacterium]|nr:hypothetical protein [Planctomycetota bacterium]